MSQKATRRIALLLGQDLGYSRRVLSGVLSAAEAKRLPWVYHNAAPDVRILSALERWRPHGIIVHLSDRSLAEALQQLSVPMVSVTRTLDGLGIPSVDVDSVAVGVAAADYFLGLGYRSFAYYGSEQVAFSRDRAKGFRERLQGYPVASMHANFLPHTPFEQDWTRMDRQTERWLKQLPKPVAVLASNDIPARVLSDTCRHAGLRVPDEVAILGVDNDVSECRMSSPALSSLEIPAEAIGREAVSMLLDQMKGVPIPLSSRSLPPLGVIVRSSTDTSSSADPLLQRALSYIESHADRGVTVLDICQYVGQSRRSLERAFREGLHSSIYQRIQKVQVARAKRLLLESSLSIGQVAERAGFTNLRQLNRVFRQFAGESPSSYRSRG